jgi:hypothetical protein
MTTAEQTTEQAIQIAEPRDTAVMPGFNSSSSWELAQRIGKAFAASSLVPQQYQGNVANCIVALEMANRMGAAPLMVMQNLYIVHGNPGWSSKFLIASFNKCGRFSAIRYQFNADRTACRAWSVEKETGERIEGPEVSMQMAKDEGWSGKSGSKWKTMPELMLMYRAAAFLIRAYAPEISMGLSTDDEIIDTVEEVRQGPSGIDAVRAVLKTVAPAPVPVVERVKTVQQFIEEIDSAPDQTAAEAIKAEALKILPPAEFAQVQQAHEAAWTA